MAGLSRRSFFGVLVGITALCLAAVVVCAIFWGYRVYTLRDSEGNPGSYEPLGDASSSEPLNTDNTVIYYDVKSDSEDRPPEADTLVTDRSVTHEETKVLSVSDEELRDLSQKLWDLDSNRLTNFRINVQNRAKRTEILDRCPDKLFSYVQDELATWSETYNHFIALLGNYRADTSISEGITIYHHSEALSFLNMILQTDVIRQLQTFLMQKGYINGTNDEMMTTMFDIWFTTYPRFPKHNVTDSSGFENVFVGEWKRRKVLGFHNWIQFYLQEVVGNLDYHGYIFYDSEKPWIINVQFSWLGKVKKESAFFVGASPEFDMAIYTLCLLTRTNKACPIDINGLRAQVHSDDVKHMSGLQISKVFLEL